MKPGQKVVCIDNIRAEELTKGEIYTIKDTIIDDFDDFGLILYEVSVTQDNPLLKQTAFTAKRFRLVDYTFGEIIAEFIEEIILEES